MSSKDIARRIREGNQKRQEELQKRQRLLQEYEEDCRAEQESRKVNGPSQYIPNILTFLVFVSFPFSEIMVDWFTVALLCVLNLGWVLCVRNPSLWMNIFLVVMLNLLLVRWSEELHSLPTLMTSIEPLSIGIYLSANAVGALLLYYGYVEKRMPHLRAHDENHSNGKHLSKKEEHDFNLEKYAEQREKADRLDVMGCVMLLANFVALLFLGVIPYTGVAQGAQAIMHILQGVLKAF